MRDFGLGMLLLTLLAGAGCGDTPPAGHAPEELDAAERAPDEASPPGAPEQGTPALRGTEEESPPARIDVARLRVAITAEGVLVFGDTGSIPPDLALRVTNLTTGESVEARTTREGLLEVVVPGGVGDALELLPLGSPALETVRLASVQEVEAERGACNCSSLTFHPDASELATVHSPLECWAEDRAYREDPGPGAVARTGCSGSRPDDLLRIEGCGMVRISDLTANYVLIDRTYDAASGALVGVLHVSDTSHGYCAVGPGSAWYGSVYRYGQVLIPGETCPEVTQCVLCGPGESGYPACP